MPLQSKRVKETKAHFAALRSHDERVNHYAGMSLKLDLDETAAVPLPPPPLPPLQNVNGSQ